MLKLNKLFLYEGRPETFDETIEPQKKERDYLVECRIKIRDHLRKGIREASISILGMDKMIEPRFRTQGSWSYGTCIRPAHSTQQMDWDYGVYMPVQAWSEKGTNVAAKTYFELVESLLESLCEENGWRLLEGSEAKETCIRIEVANWAHIDIPLYAAPEEKFQLIVERALKTSKSIALDSAYAKADAVVSRLEEDQFDWDDLEEIMMATRKGEWKASDPGEVSQWFKFQISVHGEQLQRVSRYVKAWRDYHWPDGKGPSSILLMILVTQGFAANPRREDLVLEEAIERVATGLRGSVFEKGIGNGKEDFNRLKDAERVAAANKATAFQGALNHARHRTYFERSESIKDLQSVLGSRIPNAPDFVEKESGAADTVRATEAAYVASPRVGSTSSG